MAIIIVELSNNRTRVHVMIQLHCTITKPWLDDAVKDRGMMGVDVFAGSSAFLPLLH